MVDLVGQYHHIKDEIDTAIQEVLNNAQFIKGPIVSKFENSLAKYLNVKHVIGCGNGTDALMVALMALDLKKGDEVIVPAFTYVATAEVIALLGLKPVMVDVDSKTFNINLGLIKEVVTSKTKVIIPVHLFGQCSDIEPLLKFAEANHIKIIEDNAQSLGAVYTFSNGESKQAGALGHISTTSFFPSKNLGCYGDGGALFTNDDKLAARIRMICNHGQVKKYVHSVVGVNSRLDSLQAAVLNVKLSHFNHFIKTRNSVANNYDIALEGISEIVRPYRQINSTHTFYQYTIKVAIEKRDQLKDYLSEKGIPTMVYYPNPLNKQEAYRDSSKIEFKLQNTENLCKKVISLPIHTEMKIETQNYIIDSIKSFYN